MTKVLRQIVSVSPPRGRDALLLILRISITLLMFTHGLPKLQMLLSGEPVKFLDLVGMGTGLTLGLAVFSEVFCSLLVLIGLGTRLAVIPLMIAMVIAVFHVHADDPFVKQEMGLHYLLVYGTLTVAGSGRFSVDAWVASRMETRSR